MKMTIKAQSKRLLEKHRNGKLNTRQFLYRLNELISPTRHEPNVLTEADEQWIIQTTNAQTIATIINSDMDVIAKSYDGNGYMRKVRAAGSLEDVQEVIGSGVRPK